MTKKMNKAQPAERIAKLRELIDSYRYHYHVLDDDHGHQREQRDNM